MLTQILNILMIATIYLKEKTNIYMPYSIAILKTIPIFQKIGVSVIDGGLLVGKSMRILLYLSYILGHHKDGRRDEWIGETRTSNFKLWNEVGLICGFAACSTFYP